MYLRFKENVSRDKMGQKRAKKQQNLAGTDVVDDDSTVVVGNLAHSVWF